MFDMFPAPAGISDDSRLVRDLSYSGRERRNNAVLWLACLIWLWFFFGLVQWCYWESSGWLPGWAYVLAGIPTAGLLYKYAAEVRRAEVDYQELNALLGNLALSIEGPIRPGMPFVLLLQQNVKGKAEIDRVEITLRHVQHVEVCCGSGDSVVSEPEEDIHWECKQVFLKGIAFRPRERIDLKAEFSLPSGISEMHLHYQRQRQKEAEEWKSRGDTYEIKYGEQFWQILVTVYFDEGTVDDWAYRLSFRR